MRSRLAGLPEISGKVLVVSCSRDPFSSFLIRLHPGRWIRLEKSICPETSCNIWKCPPKVGTWNWKVRKSPGHVLNAYYLTSYVSGKRARNIREITAPFLSFSSGLFRPHRPQWGHMLMRCDWVCESFFSSVPIWCKMELVRRVKVRKDLVRSIWLFRNTLEMLQCWDILTRVPSGSFN